MILQRDTEIFLAHYITDIENYVFVFPNWQEEIPNGNYKIKSWMKIFKMFETWVYITGKLAILDSVYLCSFNQLQNCSCVFFPPVFNKTPLTFPISRVWAMFPK